MVEQRLEPASSPSSTPRIEPVANMNDSEPGDAPPPSPARRGGTGPGDNDADAGRAIRRALRRYATEYLFLLTTRGELVATSDNDALGYRGEDREGHHIAEHIHPDDLPVAFDLIERARATPGFEETITLRARRADGTWGTYEATVMDATADPVLNGAVLRVREIENSPDRTATEERQPERVPQDRFLSLAESLPLGILSADARGYVVFCNEAAQQILNLPLDQLLGYGWEKAI